MEPLPKSICLDLRRITNRAYRLLEDDPWCNALIMDDEKFDKLFDIAIARSVGLVKDGRVRHKDRVEDFCRRYRYPYSRVDVFMQDVTRWLMEELQQAFDHPISNSGIVLEIESIRGLALTLRVR